MQPVLRNAYPLENLDKLGVSSRRGVTRGLDCFGVNLELNRSRVWNAGIIQYVRDKKYI